VSEPLSALLHPALRPVNIDLLFPGAHAVPVVSVVAVPRQASSLRNFSLCHLQGQSSEDNQRIRAVAQGESLCCCEDTCLSSSATCSLGAVLVCQHKMQLMLMKLSGITLIVGSSSLEVTCPYSLMAWFYSVT